MERRHAPGRRIILLVSETRDHGSRAKAAPVLEALHRANTVVDAFTFSPGREEIVEDLKTGDGAEMGVVGLVLMALQALHKNAPKEFTRETGGEYVNFSSEKGFDHSLNTLANRVHNGYALSFQPHFAPNALETSGTGTSAGAGTAAGLHRLTVRVPKYPDAVVKHREAYWVAAP